MPNYSRDNIILVRYPFSDLSSSKVRPAIIVNGSHVSYDLLIVPMTSRLQGLLVGEFAISDWKAAGLNVPSAVKRGIYTIEDSLVQKVVGQLSASDVAKLEQSLRDWLLLT
ncbi:MAG: type II toxin-antitoxin system PemK/MazF family toxin [Roseiflexaceae bacterium]|nr:type II toxin-antitoxin system PemK/MazF family toxin [Roseiflexaceae bacterium]